MKAQTCANQSTKRGWIEKEEAASLKAITDSILLTTPHNSDWCWRGARCHNSWHSKCICAADRYSYWIWDWKNHDEDLRTTGWHINWNITGNIPRQVCI